VHRSEIFPLMSVQGQKQTSRTLRGYVRLVPGGDLSRCSKAACRWHGRLILTQACGCSEKRVAQWQAHWEEVAAEIRALKRELAEAQVEVDRLRISYHFSRMEHDPTVTLQ